ncbi:MAG: hypothetical protein ACR2G7_08700 [Acidimicrobiales bacterium]
MTTVGDAPSSSAGLVLLAVGYPVAIVVLTRLVPVLRQRRLAWFVALEAGTASIAAGWALRAKPAPAVINAAFLGAFAAIWWRSGNHRR